MPKLTSQQQYNIEQVAATMAIEDMPLTERAYKHLVQQATGEKTVEREGIRGPLQGVAGITNAL